MKVNHAKFQKKGDSRTISRELPKSRITYSRLWWKKERYPKRWRKLTAWDEERSGPIKGRKECSAWKSNPHPILPSASLLSSFSALPIAVRPFERICRSTQISCLIHLPPRQVKPSQCRLNVYLYASWTVKKTLQSCCTRQYEGSFHLKRISMWDISRKSDYQVIRISRFANNLRDKIIPRQPS